MDENGVIDFSKIESIEGVYLANKYDE